MWKPGRSSRKPARPGSASRPRFPPCFRSHVEQTCGEDGGGHHEVPGEMSHLRRQVEAEVSSKGGARMGADREK